MSHRMSTGVVEARVATLNRMLDVKPYDVGSFVVSHEYQGFVVEEITSQHRSVTRHTAGNLRECKQFIDGVIVGLRLKEDQS